MIFLKNNYEHLINFFRFIGDRLFAIMFTILLVFLISCKLFSMVAINNAETVESQEILICGLSFENLSIWLTSVGLIITALWSMYQYIKNQNLKQQEKASEIARDFANNLIERMSLISNVLLQNKEVQKIIKVINSSNINQFTKKEAINIFKKANCSDIFLKIIKSKNTQKKYNKILNENYNEKEKEKFDSNFNVLVNNTLNHLEAIAINISSKAAGSQFIYESLHQMFLSTVEILYLKISDSNRNNVDKYYTNIISVYNMWNIQKSKDIKKLNKTSKKIKKLEEKMDREVEKLLKKQTKTV